MRNKDFIIGVDIGGTKTAGIIANNGRVVKALKKTYGSVSKQQALDVVLGIIEDLLKGRQSAKIKGIGVAVAGIISEDKRTILRSPNLKALNGLNIVRLFEKHFHLKTRIENDANAFALFEALYGEGIGKKIVMGLTLGTGIGGGMVINKKIYSGAHNSAGEIGHMIVAENGRKCSCGNRGCLEEYASGRALERMSGKGQLQLYKNAKKGDKQARELFKLAGHYLGIGLANIVNIFDPDIIVIGGSGSNEGNFLMKEAKRTMKRNIFSPIARIVEIKKSREPYASALGAACLL